jgi:hypothetical protein
MNFHNRNLAPVYRKAILLYLIITVLLFPSVPVWADGDKESPWLIAPTMSSDPKLGTTAGLLGGYLIRFDPESPTSMFGAMGSYSSTDSTVFGTFARTYFGQDNHRLNLAVMTGEIKNDYKDFLGTGISLKTTDDLNMGMARYTKRVHGDWFIGPQFISNNYDVLTDDWLSGKILDLIGLTGVRANGLGLVINYDSRDNQRSPLKGSSLELYNFAYRESLGGDASFDAYTGKYSTYIQHGNGHVAALLIKGRWTDDAPKGAYSSVDLNGYTRGQYLAPHMTLMQVDERFRFNDRLGFVLSAGAACLYGGDKSCNDSENWYPSAGVGLTVTIKKEEKMVLRAEYAVGKSENEGFYLKFGHPF